MSKSWQLKSWSFYLAVQWLAELALERKVLGSTRAAFKIILWKPAFPKILGGFVHSEKEMKM